VVCAAGGVYRKTAPPSSRAISKSCKRDMFFDFERIKKPPCGKTCCLLGFADLLAAYLRCRFVHFQVGLQAFHEEAVNYIAPVNSLSGDLS
jgi:hypothetical protein